VEIAQAPLTYSDLEVDRVNRLGWAALLEAILLGEGKRAHQQIVQTMAEAECRSRVPKQSADVRPADKDGVTPLQYARRRGCAAIKRALAAAGA